MNKRIVIVLLSLLLLVMVGGTPAFSDSGPPRVGPAGQVSDQPTVALQATEAESLAAQTLWTREARAAAKAFPAPAVDLDALAIDLEKLVDATPEGALAAPPGFAVGGAPDPNANLQGQHAFPEEWALIDATTPVNEFQEQELAAATGTSGVYTTYKGNLYTQMWKEFPWKATGKLYFCTPSGCGASCSASVISGNNIIVTAAHCVYDTDVNRWYSNWVFVPSERNGSAPYGTFSWTGARVLTAWINASSYNAGIRYDVALIRLGNNSSGRSVTYYTGYLGRSWNYDYVQNIAEIGYPSNLSQGNLYTYVGHAETYSGGTDLLRYGSNMGYGASGSPLLRVYAPYQSGANNYVNAVQSGSSPNGSNPTNNVAPRFSGYNIVPLCRDEGC